MSVMSMTGFGRSSGSDARVGWTWEIKSVNGRTLDIRLKLPGGLERLDAGVRRIVGQACQRGSLQIVLALAPQSATSNIRINEPLLIAILDQLNGLAVKRGLPDVSLEAVLGIRGVIETEEVAASPEHDAVLETSLMQSLDEAVSMLVETRRGEGTALKAILSDQLDRMAESIGKAATSAELQSEQIRQRLHEQVRSLMEADSRFEPQRLHQEAVMLATRADVREELDRFQAHVVAARALLTDAGAIGRRLDFLAQELFRETNTICSKATSMDLTAIGLDLKSFVEQFREQVQNVE